MKYKELTIEEARTTCKRNGKQCQKCPLRRTRTTTDEKGNERQQLLFCWFQLMRIVSEEDREELENEEIQYEEEYKVFKQKYL